jgi:hypothetical protein
MFLVPIICRKLLVMALAEYATLQFFTINVRQFFFWISFLVKDTSLEILGCRISQFTVT